MVDIHVVRKTLLARTSPMISNFVICSKNAHILFECFNDRNTHEEVWFPEEQLRIITFLRNKTNTFVHRESQSIILIPLSYKMIDIDIIRSMQQPDIHQIALRSTNKRQEILVPGPFDVICARGKQAYNHQGVSQPANRTYINDLLYERIISKARDLPLTQTSSSSFSF